MSKARGFVRFFLSDTRWERLVGSDADSALADCLLCLMILGPSWGHFFLLVTTGNSLFLRRFVVSCFIPWVINIFGMMILSQSWPWLESFSLSLLYSRIGCVLSVACLRNRLSSQKAQYPLVKLFLEASCIHWCLMLSLTTAIQFLGLMVEEENQLPDPHFTKTNVIKKI